MADIKSLNAIADKFARVTPQRAQDYAEGVKTTSVDWAQRTAEAQDNYDQGVQAAMAEGRFARGVQNAGTAKWKKGVAEKGQNRFSSGVSTAGPAYQQGFAPFHNVIQSTQLPPRYARRDPRNLERVRAIATALGEAKTQQT